MKIFYIIVKVVTLSVILVLMYHQLESTLEKVSLADVRTNKALGGNFWILLCCIILMPINWWLESIKWKYLMSPHIKISTFSALKTVLAGLAAGIVTPARLGEYGGRLVTSDPDHKTQVVSATILGSITQNLCNVAVGLGFSYFFLKNVFSVTYGQGLAFSGIVSSQILVMVWFYYNLPKVANFISQNFSNRHTLKIMQKLKTLELYRPDILHKVLFISFIRYCIYFSQYILIMFFLGANIEGWALSSNIAGIYLVQTSIPLPGFLSVLARGELAILVWSSVDIDSMTALIATYGLWMINLILPALVGVVILFGTDFKNYFTK